MHHGFIALPLQGLCKISAEQLLPRSGAAPVRRLGEAWSVVGRMVKVWKVQTQKTGVGVLKPMEWKPQAKHCSFLRRFLFSKMFETRMLLLLWKLFARAFQHTPFLLGFGIDLGQTLLLLDQAADKSKRLIEPTQLTTGETFAMCVCLG